MRILFKGAVWHFNSGKKALKWLNELKEEGVL